MSRLAASMIAILLGCASGHRDEAGHPVQSNAATRPKRTPRAPVPVGKDTPPLSEATPPWVLRDSSIAPERNDLLADARYVCDAHCTEDALVSLVEQCELFARIDHVLKSRKLTIAQLDMLEWLLTTDGIAARAAMPESFAGLDREFFGFEILSQLEALAERERAGYVGPEEDVLAYEKRFHKWWKVVCVASLVANRAPR